MSDIERLRQEADNLKNQIRVIFLNVEQLLGPGCIIENIS